MNKKTNPKTVSLLDCTHSELCRLDRDNFCYKDYWIITDTCTVTIAEQKLGCKPKQSITIPAHIFRRFVKLFQKQRVIKS